MIELTDEQAKVVEQIVDWAKNPTQQVFYLNGPAGSGKSTLAQLVARHLNWDVVFGAYTGKAAAVMRSKGCTDAKTIHSLIYIPRVNKHTGQVTFHLNKNSEIGQARLVIIDECSMVGQVIGEDLESFLTPILVIGDKAQLPPVKSAGYFTNRTPDATLTEVHRQAQDNPIIKLSQDIRHGKFPKVGDTFPDLSNPSGPDGPSKTDHRVEIISTDDITEGHLTTANQVLCGTNETRRALNGMIRKSMGLTDTYPVIGDRLVCLKNCYDKKILGKNGNVPLLNGTMWTVTETHYRNVPVSKDLGDDKIRLTIEPEDELGVASTSKDTEREVTITVRKEFFDGREDNLSDESKWGSQEFTYGYALSVHRSQGSQWDHVMVIDESNMFPKDKKNHLYTAVTRASHKLTLAL